VTARNCAQARSQLDRFLDAEMDGPVLAAVNEHLGTCPDCREAFNREGRLQVGVRRALSDERMPDDVWTRLSAALEQAERRTGGAWPMRRLLDPVRLRTIGRSALGLAVVAAGVLLAVHLFQPAEKPYPGEAGRQAGATLARAHFDFRPDAVEHRERGVPLDNLLAEFLTRDWRFRLPADGAHKVLPVFHGVLVFEYRRVLHIGVNCCGNPASVYVVPDFAGAVEMVAELGREANRTGRFFEHRRLGRAWLAAVADNKHDVSRLFESFVRVDAPPQ
jgi:hypothetical protein